MKTLQSDDTNQSPTHVLMEVDSTSENNNLNVNEELITTADSESINQQKVSNLNDEFQLKPIFMSTNTEAL